MAQGSGDGSSVAGAHRGGPNWRQEAAAHYREYAAQLRELADGEPDMLLRERLLGIADEYDRLARHLDPHP